MAPVKIDPGKVREFKDADSFYEWLSRRHNKEDEIWIKIHKVDSGLKSITPQGSYRRCALLGLDPKTSNKKFDRAALVREPGVLRLRWLPS